MKQIMIVLGLLTLVSGGIWAYSTLGNVCCGNPSALCCPLK